MCIQEHHLTPVSANFLKSLDSNYDAIVSVSSVHNESSNSNIRQGGLAILWRKNIGYAISELQLGLNTDRIMGIKIQSNGQEPIFLFNVYLPSTNASLSEYQHIIDLLQIAYDTYFEQGLVLLAGDFNAQLGSTQNTRRAGTVQTIRGKYLESFLCHNNLYSLVADNMCTGPVCTYWSDNNIGVSSQIDHFVIAHDLRRYISWCKVFDDNDLNTSDHVPIMCKLHVYINRHQPQKRTTYNWGRCDVNEYSQVVRQGIIDTMVDEPVTSVVQIDNMLQKLQSVIQAAMDRCVPKSKACPFVRPYWDQEIKEFYNDQKQKRHVWIEDGKPRGMQHLSYNSYKRAKRLFAKLLRCKQQKYDQSRFEQAERDVELDSRNLWKLIRGRQGNTSSHHAITYDGSVYSSPDELRSLWAKHYSNLLNEQPIADSQFDECFRDHIECEVTNMINTYHTNNDNTGVLIPIITINEVATICKSMPNHKSPGHDNVCYESLKYGGYLLFERLALMYNAIIKFIHVPKDMKHSIIIPLYKGKKKPRDDINSYRGISLSSIINKILERIILNRLKPWLRSNNFPPPQQQSGAEACSSVTLSYVAQESINVFRNQGSKLYACFLDIEKAFDCVWWSGLLHKISEIGIKGHLWLLFREWLIDSSCTVMINGAYSNPVPITRSIKQGGLLSMLLFCISYHDVHTDVIKPPAQGIRLYNMDMSSLTYADDTLLLAATARDLQNMIDNIHAYGAKWRIKFSPSKTVCMVFGETAQRHHTNKSTRSWHLGQDHLQEVDEFVYLGNKLNAVNCTKERTTDMCNRAYAHLGSLTSLGFNANGLSPLTSATIWKKLCIPSMLYSCETWGHITRAEYDKLEKAQRTVAKHIQGVHRRTHNEIVLGLLGWHTIEGTIDQMKLNFIGKLVLMKPSNITKRVFLHEIYNSMLTVSDRKTITSNLVQTMHKYSMFKYLMTYLSGGEFPVKRAWKSLVKEHVYVVELEKWTSGLIQKDVYRYRRVQPKLEPNQLYHVIRLKPVIKHNIMLLIKMLTIIDVDEDMLCTLCHKTLTDSVEHVMMRCEGLLEERNTMWDKLLDSVDVYAEVHLLNQGDSNILDIMLGRKWSKLTEDVEIGTFYNIVAEFAEQAQSKLGI
jgi:exonuclease III